MRNQTGAVVRGDEFFLRIKELNKLWRRIVNGNHILLSAPRRVGKSSLLRYMEDNPKTGYLQLVPQELTDHCEESDNLHPIKEDIDMAFEKLFAPYNRKNLLHWQERIERYKEPARGFIKECLNLISEEEEISKNRLHDLGKKPHYLGAVDSSAIIEDLVHDGYIHSPDGKNRHYRFNSPILKIWWARHDFK